MVKNAKDKSIQARHDLRRQKRIREQKIRRYTFFTVLGVIAILIVMFLTPLFNIKTVSWIIVRLKIFILNIINKSFSYFQLFLIPDLGFILSPFYLFIILSFVRMKYTRIS